MEDDETYKSEMPTAGFFFVKLCTFNISLFSFLVPCYCEKLKFQFSNICNTLEHCIRPESWYGRGGGGGRKVPAACNSWDNIW